jgi:hypothetical protein
VGLDGRAWVTRHVEAELVPEDPAPQRRPPINWREPPVWDVIDPRGTYLGTIRPAGGRLAAATGMRLWIVETGDFDEQYVVRYRIEPGP